MYLSIEDTAAYLEVDPRLIERFMREHQITWLVVDDEVLINTNQFEFFIKERQKALEEYQRYLDEPIPEDIDIKDED
ncbi:hypothetical protein SAMN05421767_10659 [Granulicatella balaenopterae]|uniref:DNA binding domain-containing protein, excisionase family n=1 Tax=Granulicatella balaenopterae TaxID=137733 RepID=A0A1H9IQG8_9LACT|nr:hypothetical protein [Granulicatella balaenopterae]SEQ76834.1 hypothetical protein SAMN05421767_10659 [Granulicatella balaenopterae]